MKLKLEPHYIGFKLDRAEAECLLDGQILSEHVILPGQAPIIWSVTAGSSKEVRLDGLNLTVPLPLLAAELADRPSREGLTAQFGSLAVCFQIDMRRDRATRREVRHA